MVYIVIISNYLALHADRPVAAAVVIVSARQDQLVWLVPSCSGPLT
jgi:hypothetical protein